MPLPALLAPLIPYIISALGSLLMWLLKRALITAGIFAFLLVIQSYYIELLEIIAKIVSPVMNIIVAMFGYDSIDMSKLTNGLIDVYRFCRIWIPLDFALSLFATYMTIAGQVLGWRLLRSIMPKF